MDSKCKPVYVDVDNIHFFFISAHSCTHMHERTYSYIKLYIPTQTAALIGGN